LAEALIRQGALWNAFILAGRAAALLELFKRNAPKLFLRMRAALHESSTDTRPEAIDSLYRTLTTQDFSRHIFSGQESHLRVVRVPSCGWSDLGTPKRVADTLRRLVRAGPQRFDVGQDAGGLSLASQQGSSRMPINVGR
jgi:mannose-1-phosphate guanylyltransferase